MGAPTGSLEVLIVTRPLDTACWASCPANLRIVTVARPSTECFLIASQAPASGIQVCAAASSGVQHGQFIRVRDTARVNLTSRQPRTGGLEVHFRRSIGERDVNSPARGIFRGVVPDESRRGNFGRENRTVQGIVNRDGGQVRRHRLLPASRLRCRARAEHPRGGEDCTQDEQGHSGAGSMERERKGLALFLTHLVSTSKASSQPLDPHKYR